jgi:hypothetical protein
MPIPWLYYRLDVKVDRLTGGIPANPKLLQAWLQANAAPTEAEADMTAMLERLDPEATHGVVFYRDEEGRPCYESRCLKAALKESANICKGILGEKNYRSKVAERIFVGPRLIPITVPVLSAERPITVMTMQGKRTSLKRYEYADNVPLSFTLKLLDDGVVKAAHLADLVEYLQSGGIGADRSQGSGTFEVVSLDFDQERSATRKVR